MTPKNNKDLFKVYSRLIVLLYKSRFPIDIQTPAEKVLGPQKYTENIFLGGIWMSRDHCQGWFFLACLDCILHHFCDPKELLTVYTGDGKETRWTPLVKEHAPAQVTWIYTLAMDGW